MTTKRATSGDEAPDSKRTKTPDSRQKAVLPAWVSATASTGSSLVQLVGASELAFEAVRVPAPAAFLGTAPVYPGTVEEFVKEREQHDGDTASSSRLALQCRNKVKKCTACKKPNGYTLARCNGCDADLADTPISYTSNVFAGFIFGIARGPFPLKISLRQQSERFMVFDDLMAMSPCHLIGVPTDVFIPNLRSLFERPREGRRMLMNLKSLCEGVARTQFLSHPEFRKKVFRGGEQLSTEAILAHACIGLNFPPSQYQLHLQYILPPFSPFHWNLCRKGVHFTHGRFFALDYMLAALEEMERKDVTLPGASELDMDAIIKLVGERYGVCYHSALLKAQARFYASHEALANWQSTDFSGLLLDSETLLSAPTAAEASLAPVTATSGSLTALHAADRLVLCNYGRPREEGDKTTGTYYKYAAKQVPLPEWLDWKPTATFDLAVELDLPKIAHI